MKGFIKEARYICETLAATNPDDKSFKFALEQTEKVLNEIRPQPYAGSACGLPPAKIFSLLGKFEQLEEGQIATEEFCSDFRLLLDELEHISSSHLALDNFEAVLAELLLALSQGREVSSILDRLSEAFSALPLEEKKALAKFTS